jgi:hypothetical protein
MRPRPARFRSNINRLISNRDWNAKEVEHQEYLIAEARKVKGKIHPDHYRARMDRARPARKHSINRYLGLNQQLLQESQKRTVGWGGLLRWILTPRPTKMRWARRKTIQPPTPELTKKQ